MELSVQVLSEKDFAGMESAWSELLEDSSADPLFMSWAWLYSWWQTWSSIYDLELELLAAINTDNKLQGLAPLYRHKSGALRGFGVQRLHFIGNAWKIGPSVRTEYVSILSRNGCEEAVASCFAKTLVGLTWDELVISDSVDPRGGLLGEFLTPDQDILGIVRSEAQGVRINVSAETSEQWSARLGSNTRLKALNRRGMFENELGGSFNHFRPEGNDSYREFFRLLNEFHCRRWGKPCFDSLAVDFHIRLLSRLNGDQRPRLSELEVNGEVVSVLYDIEARGCIYNLQAGFDQSWHKKMSLGTLHLGYAIECAFKDPEVSAYDLLAGYGKNTFYKAKFRGDVVGFTTLEYVRSPLLKLAYRCKTWLPRRLKSRINRVLRL